MDNPSVTKRRSKRPKNPHSRPAGSGSVTDVAEVLVDQLGRDDVDQVVAGQVLGEDVEDVRQDVAVVRRLVAVTCAWCGTSVRYSGTGRRPRYCGRACRQRAYEARTADQRTTAATIPHQEPVREVVREVEVRTRVVRPRVKAPAPVVVEPRTADQWAATLQVLVDQLGDRGHNVAHQHWKHRKLQAALAAALVALDRAHPGGLKP